MDMNVWSVMCGDIKILMEKLVDVEVCNKDVEECFCFL